MSDPTDDLDPPKHATNATLGPTEAIPDTVRVLQGVRGTDHTGTDDDARRLPDPTEPDTRRAFDRKS